jgi:hypothetical protein
MFPTPKPQPHSDPVYGCMIFSGNTLPVDAETCVFAVRRTLLVLQCNLRENFHRINGAEHVMACSDCMTYWRPPAASATCGNFHSNHSTSRNCKRHWQTINSPLSPHFPSEAIIGLFISFCCLSSSYCRCHCKVHLDAIAFSMRNQLDQGPGSSATNIMFIWNSV